MKISIKWVLVFSFTLIITISIGFIIASSYITSKNALLSHAKSVMENIVTFTVDKSKNHILVAKDAAELTKGLTSSSVVNSEDFKGMEKYFFEQLKVNRQFANIYYGNFSGDFIMLSRDKKSFKTKQITTANQIREVILKKINKNFELLEAKYLPKDKYDPRQRPWYKSVEKNKKTIWTEPYIFFESKALGITAASPVFDSKNRLIGVVGVDIELKELSTFLSNLDFSKIGKVFIFDKNMNIIASDNSLNINKDNLKLDKIEDKTLNHALKSLQEITSPKEIKKELFTSFEYDDEDFHAIFTPFEIDDIKWIIGIYLPENAYLSDIKKNQIYNIYIAIFIAILFLYVSYRIANKISHPIIQMHNVAHKLKLHHLDIPKIPLSSFSEISESVEAFNDMQEEIICYEEETNRLNQNLQNAYLDTLYRLALASEYKDGDTAEHIHRIAEYSEIIAREMNMSEDKVSVLKHASIMHDVGKLGIPDKILLKPGKLTFEEMEIMKTHSLIGGEILKDASSKILKAANIIAVYHHEKWDGSGYPYGIKGKKIPIMARIVALVDVFDALISERCYKKAYSVDKALKIIDEGRGSHFDPECVDAFEKSFEKILKIYIKYNK